MVELMDVATVFAALNTVLALLLGAVYVKNHAALKSPFTLGLLVFAAFLVLHNGIQVYYFLTMMSSMPPGGDGFLLLENVLQAGALGALLSSTWR